MKLAKISLLNLMVFIAAGIFGCSKSPGDSAPTPPSTASAAPAEKIIYLGELEFSKFTPVHVTIEETNDCTISTMVLPGGSLNLDIVVETKSSSQPPPHISVSTRAGQQFTFQIGNVTVGYTAKLKVE
jgi:hypothetical protein